MAVRSRNVDTFNQGGGNPTNLFQSPSVRSIKPTTVANPKFLVPSPVSAAERPIDNTFDSVVSSSAADENPSAFTFTVSIQPPATPSSKTMQRFASMDNISYKGQQLAIAPHLSHAEQNPRAEALMVLLGLQRRLK